MRSISFLLLFTYCTALTLAFTPFSAAAADADYGQQRLEKALERETDIQDRIEDWSREKQELMHRILRLKSEADWHKYRTAKYQEYIRRKNKRIDKLKREKERVNSLSRELEPYLDRVVADLAAFVESDLAFLARERQRRLKTLRQALGSYDTNLSDKLGRVLQAMQIEADYGRSVEVHTDSVQRDGQKIRVQVLRLGRVAKFYRSPDGEYAGRWTRSSGEWVPIDPAYAQAIRKAIRMTRDQAPAQLVELPIKGERQ